MYLAKEEGKNDFRFFSNDIKRSRSCGIKARSRLLLWGRKWKAGPRRAAGTNTWPVDDNVAMAKLVQCGGAFFSLLLDSSAGLLNIIARDSITCIGDRSPRHTGNASDCLIM